MNGMEMITAAKYYRKWSDPRLIVAVLDNGDLNQVTWEMRAMTGSPQLRAVTAPVTGRRPYGPLQGRPAVQTRASPGVAGGASAFRPPSGVPPTPAA
jgi:hypothetical protein